LTVLSVHPGYTATNLQYTGAGYQKSSWIIGFMNGSFAQSSEMGCLPTVYAAVSKDVEPGAFYGPDGVMELGGYPVRVKEPKSASDEATARGLWEESEKLTGLSFDFSS
jgi:hypothetical protein